MNDVDLTEAPPLPEWLARDPEVRPAPRPARAEQSPALELVTPQPDDQTHDGPTLPTLDDVIGLPSAAAQAAKVAARAERPVAPEADPNDWLLVALAVSASSVLVGAVIMVLGRYGAF